MKEYKLLVKGGEYFAIEAMDVFEALQAACEMIGVLEYRVVGVVWGKTFRVSLEAGYHALKDSQKHVLFQVCTSMSKTNKS